LLRELNGLFELQKILWANEMRQFIVGMSTHKNADLANGKTPCDSD